MILILVSTVLLLSFCSIVSYRIGFRNQHDATKRISTLVPTSIYGLLALILSFSFSMSVSRYEDRRKLAVDEANAIGTSYLRVRLLREVPGTNIHDLYKRYLEERILFYQDMNSKHKKRALEIQKEIWLHYEAITKTDRTAMESLYAYGLNGMIDIGNARTFALIKTMPVPIYFVILFMALVAFSVLNFDRGFLKEKGHWGVVTFILLFTIIFTLIYDIDHPRTGLIRISQDALIETRDLMRF